MIIFSEAAYQPFSHFIHYRDGERIELYCTNSCSNKDCGCTSSIDSSMSEVEKGGKSFVTLHLHKGLYHERFGDKVKLFPFMSFSSSGSLFIILLLIGSRVLDCLAEFCS